MDFRLRPPGYEPFFCQPTPGGCQCDVLYDRECDNERAVAEGLLVSIRAELTKEIASEPERYSIVANSRSWQLGHGVSRSIHVLIRANSC